MEKLVKVVVVTPVHNRRDITIQCLRSLFRARLAGISLHVIVVDDGSTDGTSDAIRREYPQVELIAGDGDLWFTEGTNVGVRAALKHDPKYILTMNDDQVFDERFLEFLVETAEQNPRSVVGPLLLLWDQPHRIFQTAPVWRTLEGGWVHWYSQTVWTVPDKPWHVDAIVGNCVLVPREGFTECGLLDSARHPLYGDAEFTPRLKKHGWNLIIDPRSRVFCQPNVVPTRVTSMSLRELFNALFVDLKNGHNLRRRLYVNLDTGPSRSHAVFAFLIFLARALIGRQQERSAYGRRRPEKPLREVFANSVIDGPAPK
jgi:GT2 family glycosyltransferase